MKLSNKILIGFFGFILIYMMAAFAEIRFLGYKRDLSGTEVQVEKAPLGNVGYIVLSDSEHRVTISSSNEPHIEVKSIDGSFLSNLNYEMVGDTLNLKINEITSSKPVQVTVFVSQNTFRGLQATRASASLTNLSQQALSITQSGGSIRMDGDVNVTNLSIAASDNANLDASGLSVNSLSVKIDHSKVMIWSPVVQLRGSILNDSFLRIDGVDDIQFTKDKSSKIQIQD
ncbi:DUF2807 domain-containing protein [Imperialibacter roseus]|uniref:DUF2807 domain-containing protein n=1 Tax=Imperialibacter roseus TaxID=1324217 RepID=A0ABZ0IXE7_9BACT|nr:DUF2807 domain-containing protein [Imperialibacter roseus]WOK09192.1 DUF2807 domain-containing protein [Imperialibacter roseus]